MQQQRGQLYFLHARHDTFVKKNLELSLEKVRKHLLPKRLHLRTDVDIEIQPKVPQSNKHLQSTKHKSSFKRHSREKSDVDKNLKTNYLFLQTSHKPSKRHSLKENEIHSININKSAFIGRKGSTTNSNSIDKIVGKQNLSPYRNSITKYRSAKAADMFRSKHPSGKLRKNIEKLKTQESRDEQLPVKETTVKTTPESYNLLTASARPREVLTKHSAQLSMFEQAEILQYELVYFLSKNSPTETKGDDNLGFDDKKGHYICSMHDQVAYRYEVFEELGRGSFGQVYKAFDHKQRCLVALKIVKNKKTPNNQAKIQFGILRYIRDADEDGCVNVVQVREAFQFRKHFCMTFEILSHNLYELIKLNKFLPLSGELIRRISIQVLSTLLFLFKHNIVHCDIKPQNILLKSSDKSGIKIIDFGSSCFSDQKLYTYIQSRYYRAPEVILGYDYSTEIDIWSFGCVVAEMKLSYPIFSGDNEDEQVGLITEVIGLPKPSFYENTERGNIYFGSGSAPLRDRDGAQIQPKTRLLTNLFTDVDFADFLSRIFVWDPKERITPIEALKHKWIMKGLPNEIRHQHLQYLAEQEQYLQQITRMRVVNNQKERLKTHGQTLSEQLLVKALKSIE